MSCFINKNPFSISISRKQFAHSTYLSHLVNEEERKRQRLYVLRQAYLEYVPETGYDRMTTRHLLVDQRLAAARTLEALGRGGATWC